MKIIKYLLNFSKEVIKSRIAQLFFLIHWILFVIAVYQRGDTTLTNYHFAFEPLLVQILTIINLPAFSFGIALCLVLMFTIGTVFESILKMFGLEMEQIEKIVNSFSTSLIILCMFLSVSLQWILVGYGLEKLIKRFLNRG